MRILQWVISAHLPFSPKEIPFLLLALDGIRFEPRKSYKATLLKRPIYYQRVDLFGKR